MSFSKNGTMEIIENNYPILLRKKSNYDIKYDRLVYMIKFKKVLRKYKNNYLKNIKK